MITFKNMNKIQLAKILHMFMFLCVIWLLGLLIFITNIPEETTNVDEESDAVVVLTGGSMRLHEGIKIFDSLKAKKILISGVGEGVTKKDIVALLKASEAVNNVNLDNVVLGEIAENTYSNAIETKIFMELNNFKSIRLVTSNYHIIRSYMIFKRVMPEYKIIVHPVCSDNFKKKGTLISFPSFRIAISEYTKYIGTIVMDGCENLENLINKTVREILIGLGVI
jgi:uncharacterized SAM-binding protein YcdF (DUF218 family)